ncbi:MAG TPA: zf-HC2 domain-containing protein [Bryobacteraceae bacterium]
MSNNFYSPHPEDDELLSYSDNELEGAGARSVRKHLKECWRCRTQLEDLQATVTGFMRYREHTLVPNLPAPPQPWKNLKGDFDRVDRENNNLADRSRMFARFGPLPAMRVSRIAVGIAALAVIGFGFGYYYVLRPDVPVPVVKTAEQPVPAAPAVTGSESPVIVKPEVAAQPAPVVVAEQPVRVVSTEVEVAVALHRAAADLGEPVEVLREPDRIVVTGTALPASRRQELTSALAPIAGVSIRWEDSRITPNPSRPNANFDAGRLPWQAELEAALGGKSALEKTSNELLDLSDAVTARTVALKKLHDRFAAESLKPAEQEKIDGIAADHQRELRKAVDALNRRAAPVFAKLGVAPETGSLNGQAGSVFEAAQKTDQLLNVLFAGVETNRTLPQTVEELRNAMARLRVAAAN